MFIIECLFIFIKNISEHHRKGKKKFKIVAVTASWTGGNFNSIIIIVVPRNELKKNPHDF